MAALFSETELGILLRIGMVVSCIPSPSESCSKVTHRTRMATEETDRFWALLLALDEEGSVS